MSDDVLIRVEGVSKKFCRSLKRSLWYGVQDTVSDLLGRDSSEQQLRHNEFWAVNDVSFEVRRGECLGLIGRNGAGKTTLLKMLNGLIKPDRGRIEMRGRVGALIALGAGFNPILTGRENIYVNGAVLGMSKKEIDAKYDEIVDFAGIGEFIDAPVQSYSSGMQVRLGFAVAVAVRPHILLLDEVLAVGDINFQAKCFNTLAKFRKDGTAFILVSHNMHMIARHCQSVLYIQGGQVAHMGDVDEALFKFSSDLATPHEPINSGLLQWTKSVGTGRIAILDAQFFNNRHQPISSISAGDAVSLSLSYQRRDPLLTSVVLDVVIRDGDEQIYQATNLSSGNRFDPIFDNGRFTVHFEYLPTNVDCLDFFVTLLDVNTSEVFDWKRNIRLYVKRNSHYHGKLVLPSTWTNEPSAHLNANAAVG